LCIGLTVKQGIIAVSQKPADQSWGTYVIELQERFPLGAENEAHMRALWRQRAVFLEEELRNAQIEVQKLSLGKI
jgi:hypothetical protein